MTTPTPLVSVIIPTYNSEKYITQTIRSILAQNFDDFEIIVVNDKSTDNTEKVVKQIGSDKIRYFCLDENHGGPSQPRNIGVEKSRGKFIALCDSDDLFTPGRLKYSVEFLQKNQEIGLVFMDIKKFCDDTGKEFDNFFDEYPLFQNLPKKKVADDCYVISPEDAFSCLFYENYIMTSGVTIRKDVFTKVGYFDEALMNGDDGDMWCRIAREYPLGYIDRVGYMYRTRTNSISTRGHILAENRIKLAKKRLQEDLPKELQKRCCFKLSKYYFAIGHHYQTEGQMREARDNYLLSLSYSRNVNALKGILITFLGVNLYNTLKKVMGTPRA